MTRQESYNEKRKKLSKRCEDCRKSIFPPTSERCNECTIGRKLRMLEVEYSDVTGWTHNIWKTKRER